MDTDSALWLACLRGTAPQRAEALSRLHSMMVRVAMREANLRGPSANITGPELDDLAFQSANDAMMALLVKLDTFRGDSRFTTWAYRFVALEVANKIGRHAWRRPAVPLDPEEWERLRANSSADPLANAMQRDLITAVERAVEDALTEHQRQMFIAVAVLGVPLDSIVAESGSSRGAIYKTVFDARRKIRRYLTAQGYLEDYATPQAVTTGERENG